MWKSNSPNMADPPRRDFVNVPQSAVYRTRFRSQSTCRHAARSGLGRIKTSEVCGDFGSLSHQRVNRTRCTVVIPFASSSIRVPLALPVLFLFFQLWGSGAGYGRSRARGRHWQSQWHTSRNTKRYHYPRLTAAFSDKYDLWEELRHDVDL